MATLYAALYKPAKGLLAADTHVAAQKNIVVVGFAQFVLGGENDAPIRKLQREFLCGFNRPETGEVLRRTITKRASLLGIAQDKLTHAGKENMTAAKILHPVSAVVAAIAPFMQDDHSRRSTSQTLPRALARLVPTCCSPTCHAISFVLGLDFDDESFPSDDVPPRFDFAAVSSSLAQFVVLHDHPRLEYFVRMDKFIIHSDK